MHYVRKKDFDEVFNLKKLINNDLLIINHYDEVFYSVSFNEKIYERLIKISKLSYSNNIKKILYTSEIDLCVKIIKYSKKHSVSLYDVSVEQNAREISELIDEDILNRLFNMKRKNNYKK